MSEHTLNLIQEKNVKWIDLRFTDFKGKEQHLTIPASVVNEDFFEDGQMFDGSSFAGWKGIDASDMIMMPDANSCFIDPFMEDVTLVVRCDIIEPATMQGYERDPRSVARRAEEYLKSTGYGDTAFFGPEPEFFMLDDVRWGLDSSGVFYRVNSLEGAWNSNATMPGGNMGHRPRIQGGYLPVPPVDSHHDIRAAMCNTLEQIGLTVEVHHHEVASAGQNEIGVKFNTLLRKADEVQMLKYVVHNVAHAYGKSATFMPKPIMGENGSGMHVHISYWKDGVNQFAGDSYAGLSEQALFFIGGIIKHAKALNAFTNPSTNSYKRLVPGFEAPVMLAYSARNRSASIRIPHVASPRAKRIEARFPDPMANPYLAFSALLMAGLDGVKNKIHPGDAADKDLYDLPAEEAAAIPQVCHTLREAVESLRADHDFLMEGGVFSKDMIDAYIKMKMDEVLRYEQIPHPLEFEMYYSL